MSLRRGCALRLCSGHATALDIAQDDGKAVAYAVRYFILVRQRSGGVAPGYSWVAPAGQEPHLTSGECRDAKLEVGWTLLYPFDFAQGRQSRLCLKPPVACAPGADWPASCRARLGYTSSDQ